MFDCAYVFGLFCCWYNSVDVEVMMNYVVVGAFVNALCLRW